MIGLSPKQLKKLAGGQDSGYNRLGNIYEGCGFWGTRGCIWGEPFPTKHKEGKRKPVFGVRPLPQDTLDGLLAGILGEVAPVEIGGLYEDFADARVRMRGEAGECVLSARQLAYGLTVAKAGPKAEPTYHLLRHSQGDGVVIRIAGVVKAIIGAYIGDRTFDNPTWSFRVRGKG